MRLPTRGLRRSLDLKGTAGVFAMAIIAAAVVLGVYHAFASDIRTRGDVTVARFEAIARHASCGSTATRCAATTR